MSLISNSVEAERGVAEAKRKETDAMVQRSQGKVGGPISLLKGGGDQGFARIPKPGKK